jgi:hypothetical protein
MSSGSSGRKDQASLHNPKALTDMEPTADWAARYGQQPKDKKAMEEASRATEQTKKSGKTESTGKKKVSYLVEDLLTWSC